MIDKKKILIVRNNNRIIISYEGKRLIINDKNILFNKIKNKSKDEIKDWFVNQK